MAAKKKAATTGKKVNKSEFVRSHADLTPAQIVAKANAAGIKLSPTYVYTVRSNQNKAKARKAAGAPKKKNPLLQHLDHIRALRTVILHVGIDRAKEMMDQIVTDLTVMP